MTSNNREVGSDDNTGRLTGQHQDDYELEEYNVQGGGISEIEEFDVKNNNGGGIIIKPAAAMEIIREEVEGSVYSFGGGGGDDVVYVAVGRQSEETSSMGALIWVLDNVVVPSSTLVFLIHVFPETKYIPTPLGKLPISQVNREQKEKYMSKERAKTRDFLQKFINLCSPTQVKVETILIESDMEAKAILDLIPILNIKKLVLGSTKSNLRKMRSKKGNSGVLADQILQNAPEICEVKIICEGKEMSELPPESPSPSPSPRATDRPPKFAQGQEVQDQQQKETNDLFACGCFKI
ncbi:hypothetical protein ACP275_13G128800 [Erythranthe tilingii]